MIKREYHCYSRVYTEEKTYSQHDFALSIKSWLPWDIVKITDYAEIHAKKRSDFGSEIGSTVIIVSLTRLK